MRQQGQGSAFNWRYDGPLDPPPWGTGTQQGDGDEFNWRFIADRQQGEGGLFTRRRDHRDAPPWADGYLNAAAAYVFGHGENDEERGDDYDRRIVNLRRTVILRRWVILVELAISRMTYGFV